MTPTQTTTPDTPPRAAVVVVHGLNTKPEVMDEMIGFLVRNGFGCVRVSLYDDALGARTPPTEVASAWTDRVGMGIHEARTAFPNLPVEIVGFSTGAMACLHLLDSPRPISVDRMFLLAPPVALRFISKLVRPLVPLWRLGLGLPSAAPRSVRQRSWTRLSEYGALILMHDALRRLSKPELIGSIPTRVVVDRRDELVDLPGVAEWAATNDLGQWTVRPIIDRNPDERVHRHLVVTRAALGHAGWTSLTTDLLRHLAR